MPNILKSLAALSFIPMLLAPITVQAQDAGAAQQSSIEADREAARVARQAEKEAARVREQQEKEAEKAAKAAQKEEDKKAKAAEKEARKAEKEAKEASEDKDKEARKAARNAEKEAQDQRDNNAAEASVMGTSLVVSPDKADPDNILYLDLSTGGRVTIQLYPEIAPNHVERIKTLARQGFYDGIIFHRVIDGFMAQTGDPTGTGTGGSDLPDVAAEFNKFPHLRGSVSMARAQDPNSANSQFFIVFYPRFSLDNSYTNFGRVISGMEYVDAVPRGEPPSNPAKILQASLKSQNKPEPNYAAQAQPAERAISVDELNAPISN
ncbi:cyclophilin family peptidyl-prolyl cis-trans isomerase [Blastomonas natatoria]|uniref:peptidylprolyl isomerase n=1 Tax=Blastomonas natatoria TaxID=34015 RepID=A0A2V3VC19_9SPHN|nr:cyclophilin family peptidyl-prolyl cis-trans isomerase [Blastomonas natatoria]